MNLDELRWFVVLAETEHVTDAAAELGISQPTLSRALAPDSSVTQALVPQAALPPANGWRRFLSRPWLAGGAMLAAIEIIVEPSPGSTVLMSGTVRLAFLHSQASGYVPALLRRFRAEAPGVQFHLVQGAAHEIVERLAGGQTDLAITSPRPDGYRWRGLYVERLCLAVPRGHPFASRARIRLADAGGEAFVGLAPGFGLRQLTDKLCAEAGIEPDVVFEAMEIPTMEGLVAAGFGVAIVPMPRPERAEPRAVYLPLAQTSAKRQLGLAWSADRALPPVAKRFAEFVIRISHEVD